MAQASESLISNADLVALHQGRADTYALLSRLYQVEIDADLLARLKNCPFITDTGNNQIDEGHRLMNSYLKESWENTLTELAVDYVRCFIGHGMDMYSAAYPYESVYTSKKRLLMQEARDEVMAIYHADGIVTKDTWHEGEDHVALELEYMRILAARTAQALKDGDGEKALTWVQHQNTFMHDHLAAWAPMMTSDLRKYAKTDLYRGLAFLTDGFLAEDAAFLDDLLAEQAPGKAAPKLTNNADRQ